MHLVSGATTSGTPIDYYYPGDDVTDVVGHNFYDDLWQRNFDSDAVWQPYGKVFAVPQAGPGPTRDGSFASAAHRVLECNSQSRKSLSGIQDCGLGAGYRIDECPGLGRHCRQRLQKIEAAPLCGQQAARATVDFANDLAACEPIAVPRIPVNADFTINLPETFFEPGRPAQHRRLARDDARMRLCGGRHQSGRYIARADVLGEDAFDVFPDFGCQVQVYPL